jgi:hypothetical protein
MVFDRIGSGFPRSADLHSLKDYFLGSNRFTRLNWIDFVTTIRKIDVSDNTIEEIPDEFFWKLPELEIFVACRNRLK